MLLESAGDGVESYFQIGQRKSFRRLIPARVTNSAVYGDPVFNLLGEVVGIVSQILTKSGGFEGIGFAATSKMARQLLLDQKMFWSGVEGMLIEGDLARALKLPQAAGFLIQRVAKGSPA